MSSSGAKKMKLKTSDGKVFEVGEEVYLQSETLKQARDIDFFTKETPVSVITSDILEKVIKYCERQAANVPNFGSYDLPKAAENEFEAEFLNTDRTTIFDLVSVTAELRKFEEDFINVDQTTLFDLILAANYLNIPRLLNLTCQKVADMLKGKTPEWIRKEFNIENDFTVEEEEDIRRQNEWVFE